MEQRDHRRVQIAVELGKRAWRLERPHRLLGDCESSVFAVDEGDWQLVVRVTDVRHRSHEEIAAELDFIEHLAARGVSVAGPVRSAAGSLVERVDADGCDYVIAVFTHVAGVHFEIADHGHPGFFRSLRRLVAALHRHQRDYVPSPRIRPRRRWDEADHIAHPDRYLPAGDHEIRDAFADRRAWLDTLPAHAQTFGLVHTDIHHGNYLIEPIAGADPRLNLFDFDDLSRHFFAYDIAIPIHYVRLLYARQRADASGLPELETAYLDAYEHDHALPAGWRTQLGPMLQWRALEMYGWIHKMWDMSAPAEHREFVARCLRRWALEPDFSLSR